MDHGRKDAFPSPSGIGFHAWLTPSGSMCYDMTQQEQAIISEPRSHGMGEHGCSDLTIWTEYTFGCSKEMTTTDQG